MARLGNNGDVSVGIGTDYDGKGFEQAQKGLKSTVEKMKENFLELSLAAYETYHTILKAWDLAEMAAIFDEQKIALNNLAAQYNMTADDMISSIKRASEGVISKSAALTVANKGLMMGLDPDQLERFTVVAKRFAGALGTDTSGAFERLTQASAVGNERMLKGLGIMVDFQRAQDKYAYSLNTVTTKLTEEEKQRANVNAVLEKSSEILNRMGPDVDTAADSMDRFKAAVSDVALFLGKVLISAISYLTSALAWLSAGFNQFISSIMNSLAWIVSFGEKLPFVGEKFKGLGDEIRAQAAIWDSLAQSSMNLSMDAAKVGTNIWKEGESVKGNTAAHKDNQIAIKSTIEERQKLIESAIRYDLILKQNALKGQGNAAEVEIQNLKVLQEQRQAHMEDYVRLRQYWEGEILNIKKAEIEKEIEAENKRYATLEKSRLSGEALGALELEHASNLAEKRAQIADVEKEVRQKEIKDRQERLTLTENRKAIEEEYLATLSEAANARARAEKERTQAKGIDNLSQAGLAAELDLITNNEEQKNQLLLFYSNERIDMAAREIGVLVANTQVHAWAEESRGRIVSASYQAMQNQLLSLIETHKFSVGAFAQAIAQQVKIELTGLAARATIWAIYETAMGLKATAAAFGGDPLAGAEASAHYASAAQFAAVAGGALVAAAGVQALFGGHAQQPAPGTPGGQPITTQPVSYSATDAVGPAAQTQPGRKIEINVYGNLVDHAALVRELAPYIDEAKGDKVSFGN